MRMCLKVFEMKTIAFVYVAHIYACMHVTVRYDFALMDNEEVTTGARTTHAM